MNDDNENQTCSSQAEPNLLSDSSADQPNEKNHPRKCRFLHSMWNHFNDYSENTTIHGVKYMGERKRPIAEKIWWLIGFLLCIGGLVYFIQLIVVKWQKSPVILVQNEKPTNIYKVPFPAVTFCPMNKLKTSIFQYQKVLDQLSDNKDVSPRDFSILSAISHICDIENLLEIDSAKWHGHSEMNVTNIKIMRNQAPSFNTTFSECFLARKPMNCSEIFTEIITEDGICYTFNIANEIFDNDQVQNDFKYYDQPNKAKGYDWDDGYLTGDIENSYPHRTYAAGQRHALKFIFKTNPLDKSQTCRGIQENRLTLHDPLDYPQPSRYGIDIPSEQYVDVEVIPRIVFTSSKLRSYDPNRRQCFFELERPLQYFKFYTLNNCRLECVANLTLKTCGCMKFSMPRGKGIPMCGIEKAECVANIWNEVDNMVSKQRNNDEFSLPVDESQVVIDVAACNCLPECKSTDYDADVNVKTLSAARHFRKRYRIDPKLLKSSSEQVTVMNIYFKSTTFMATKRNELYGISDLISNFGGLLGLFLGGSVLSLVEILYFCTIRRCCSRNS